jgi:hypothetical protein
MYLLLHFFVIDVFLYIVSIFREGSVNVDFLISLITELTADDLRKKISLARERLKSYPRVSEISDLVHLQVLRFYISTLTSSQLA